jgi:hypothetical protein
MIERKGTEVFGGHNDGETLAFIGKNARDGIIFPGVKPSDMHQL